MTEKKNKNIFKTFLFDYYLTNKEISANERKKEGYKHKGFNGRELSMLFVLCGLVILLCIKSIVIDPYDIKGKSQEDFSKFVSYSIDRTYKNGGLGMNGLFAYRIIDMEEVDEDVVIRFKDEKTGEMQEVFQNPTYKATVRKYFIGVFPVKTLGISAPGAKDVREQDENVD